MGLMGASWRIYKIKWRLTGTSSCLAHASSDPVAPCLPELKIHLLDQFSGDPFNFCRFLHQWWLIFLIWSQMVLWLSTDHIKVWLMVLKPENFRLCLESSGKVKPNLELSERLHSMTSIIFDDHIIHEEWKMHYRLCQECNSVTSYPTEFWHLVMDTEWNETTQWH